MFIRQGNAGTQVRNTNLMYTVYKFGRHETENYSDDHKKVLQTDTESRNPANTLQEYHRTHEHQRELCRNFIKYTDLIRTIFLSEFRLTSFVYVEWK